MTVEQWLADLAAKAKEATPGVWHIIEADDERFMSAVYVATTPEDATPGETPEVVIATIDELLRLREENERLEKEADWLAERLAKYCVDDAEKECPLIDVCPEGSCPTITTSSWREVARRAVREA